MRSQEKSIITKIRKGNKEIFRELFVTYYHRLFLYAKSYVGTDSDAEDIVQDLFFHLWERRREIDIYSSISSYLFRAVHNKSIQFLRHRKVASGYEERHRLKLLEAELLYQSGDFSFSSIQLREIQELLRKAYDSLPEKAKMIYTLSREENRTNKDIANSLNISIKTVEYHIKKSLTVFRLALRDYMM